MILTRRTILAGAATAGTVPLLDGAWLSRAFAQAATQTRYSATSPQGKQMLVKYARAVGLMNDNSKFPKTDPRSWDFQWYTHWIPGPQSPWSAVKQTKQNTINQVFGGQPPNDPHRVLANAMWDDCQAHGQNPSDPNFFQELFFCPWHRWFVFYFEQIIRGVLQDQTFTLPYWDYLSGKVSDLSIPPEFRDQNSPLFRGNRNSWANAGERIDKQNPGSLNLDAFGETIYIDTPDGSQGFCPLLDDNPHGLVHVYVGGTKNMGKIPYAAGDPVFWLHHCNIDRLWESWNRISGRNNPQWPNRSFPFADASGKAVSVKPAGANRVALLNYKYDKYYTPRAAPRTRLLAATAAAAGPMLAKVTQAAAAEPVTLDAERMRVELSPPPELTLAPPAAQRRLAAAPAAPRRMYLVLGGISAPEEMESVYNVYLDLPEGAGDPGTQSPHYVGTLHFFAAGQDEHSPAHHRTAFNVSNQVKALEAKGLLAATPTVTLLRKGAEPSAAKPVVREITLTES
jgi:tyrosinase